MCLFLVIVGLVMYYLNTRIKTVESSVAQQNIMMSDVVSSIRKDVYESEQEVVDELDLEPTEVTVLDAPTEDRVYVSEDSAESDTESEAEAQPDENIKVEVEEALTPEPTYNKMKVDQLRKLIQESNLAPSESVPKLKKQEMIDILTN